MSVLDDIVVVLIVLAVVALASIPFVVRARDRRRESVAGEVDTAVPPRQLPDLAPTEPPPGDVLVEPRPEPEVVEPEPEVVPEPGPEVPPRFRDRLAKARATVSGYLGSILGRGVDAETWDELGGALIRADVGVAATQRARLGERMEFWLGVGPVRRDGERGGIARGH